MSAAYSRIRKIETGSARSIENLIKRPWTEQEIKTVRESWGLILPHEWLERLPGRSYRAISNYARNHNIRATEIRRARPVGEIRPKLIGGWTAEEILVLYDNSSQKAWEILGHSRTKKAIERMMSKMGIRRQPPSERWSDPEIVLIKNIIRSNDALVSRHNRSIRAIQNKIDKERKRQRFAAAASAAVKSACANLEQSVRQDVESEVLILLLSKSINTAQVGDVIRGIRTRIYGRRHLSLDAPIGDGSATWIENVSSDQFHF